jgi:hypothetical protein
MRSVLSTPSQSASRIGGVGRQFVAGDLEVRRVVEEPEVGRDVLLGGVVDVVAVEPDGDGDDDADDDQLERPLEHPDVPPQRDPGAQGAGQRYGGE